MKTRAKPIAKGQTAIPIEREPIVPPSANHGQRKRPALWRWAALLGLLSLAAYGIWRWLSILPEVVTAAVVEEDFWTSFTAEGVVRGTEYLVGSEFGGRVVELRVREGDAVVPGQTLFRLNSERQQWAAEESQAALRSAVADLARAERERDLLTTQHQAALSAAIARKRQAELEHRRLLSGARPEEIEQAAQRTARARTAEEEAEKSFRRAEALFSAGAIARASLERAEAAYRTAQADLRAAEAAERLLRAGPSPEQIEVSEAAIEAAESDVRSVASAAGRIEVAKKAVAATAARVDQARASLRNAQSAVQDQFVRAPSEGTVTKLMIENGAALLPGAPALVISNRKDLRVEAEISTEDMSKISTGMEVVVTAAAYPGRTFRSKVRSLMPAGELKPDAAIRTRIVRARVELLQSPELFRPGMEVDVEGRRPLGKFLVVPTDAVRFIGDNASVFLLENDLIVERPVMIGVQNSNRTQILSGLRGGEEVLLRGTEELKAGDRVRAVR